MFLQCVLFITTSTEEQAEDNIVLRRKNIQTYFLTYLNIFATKFIQNIQLFYSKVTFRNKDQQ